MKKVIFSLMILLSTSSLLAQSYEELKKEAYGLYEGGEQKEALSVVTKFVKSHPKSYKAQNLLAVLHYWSGHHKKAKKILEDILTHTKFPEANKLLSSVNKQLHIKNKPSYKEVRMANKVSQLTDLEYLVKQVDENPNDIKNRVLLSKFYFKIEQYQKSYDMAHEVLEIDPNNKKMRKIESLLAKTYKLAYTGSMDDGSVIDKDKAKALLKKLHTEKNYNAYMNLYEALKSAHVVFSKEEYVDILHASIMIGKYEEAQALIAQGILPVSKNSLKVQLLLSKKISQQVANR